MPGKKKNNNNQNIRVQVVAGASKSARKRARQKVRQQQNVNHAATTKAIMGISMRAKAAGNSEEQLLAMSMGLPVETGAIRFPTVDAPRTAVMNALDQITITSNETAEANWGVGDILVAYFGQPGRLASIYANMKSPSYYPLLFDSNAGTTSNWYITNDSVTAAIDVNTPWPLVATGPGTGVLVHGKTMALGVSEGQSYIFCNIGDKIKVLHSTNVSSNLVGSAIFELHRWVGKDSSVEMGATHVTFVGGLIPDNTILFTIPNTGYYKVDFGGIAWTSGTSTGPIGVTMQLDCLATDGWMQVSMGDLDVNNNGDAAIGSEVRVNAASMLLTNTTSIMNRQGTVLAGRIRSMAFTDVTPTTLARIAEKYTGDAALGVYTFKEFSDYSEQFRNVVLSDVSRGIVFDLDMDDYFHFVQITCPAPETSANTYTLSFSTSLEFKTDVARYQKDVSRMNYVNLIAARKLINSRPEWFYENPVHAKQIYQFIKNLAGSAVRGAAYAAPYVAKAASAYNPAGAPAYEMLAHMLRGLVLR